MAVNFFPERSIWAGFRWTMLSLSLLIGCSGSSSESSPASSSTAQGMTAAELLDKMRATYFEAKTYTDNARYVRSAVLRSEGVARETPFFQMSVAFQRPNKVRFKFHEAGRNAAGGQHYDVASDGTRVRSSASSAPRQVHETIAPIALTIENFIPEPVMRGAILGVSLENLYPPLLMLMAPEEDRSIFPVDNDPQLLEEQDLDGANCYRVRMNSPAGKRVLWIDKSNYLLRRMELPIQSQLKLLNPDDMFSQISIYVDFEDSTLDAEIDASTFEMEVAEGVRRVRRFIPPAPPGPSPDLGEPVGDFRFASLDGAEVSKATLAGKLAVFDFWFTGCPPCKMQTPILEKVYQAFKDNQEVAFYSVSTDPARISNEVVGKTMVDWGGNMPVLRDSGNSGYHQLNIRATPTIVVLGRDGRLQMFQAGLHRHPEPLINAIQKLVDGEDLAANAIAEHQRQLLEYEQVLEAATIKDSLVEVDVARPEIPPRRLPASLQLEQLWQSSPEQLNRPGDVLAVEGAADEEASILILDAGMEIVALDASGKILGRHRLPEHSEQNNGFLRSAVDSEGHRWYLASGVGWQQVFLFNHQWEQTLSFPDEAHSGIGDVLLADVASKGAPIMYVGYWGGLGVQGGTLDGRRLWSNRRLDHVLQVVQGDQEQVWCSSTRGTVMQLSADGKPVKELYVAGHSLMSVSVAEEESSAHFCGLAIAEFGQYWVVGFDRQGAVQWEYELPRGEYSRQVPRIQSVQLAKDKPAWLVAAADGSLHWLSPAGELIDQFHYGEPLTGVATSYANDTATLWVATDKNLTAWKIEPMPEP